MKFFKRFTKQGHMDHQLEKWRKNNPEEVAAAEQRMNDEVNKHLGAENVARLKQIKEENNAELKRLLDEIG